jgi:hypothetical protein
MTQEQIKELGNMLQNLENVANDTLSAPVIEFDIFHRIKTCNTQVKMLPQMEQEDMKNAIISTIYSLLEYIKLKTDNNPKLKEVNTEAIYILFTINSWNAGSVLFL